MINGFNFANPFVPSLSAFSLPKLKIGQCIKNRLFLLVYRTNWFSGLHHARCSGLAKHPTAKGNYIPMLTKNIIKVKAIKKGHRFTMFRKTAMTILMQSVFYRQNMEVYLQEDPQAEVGLMVIWGRLRPWNTADLHPLHEDTSSISRSRARRVKRPKKKPTIWLSTLIW